MFHFTISQCEVKNLTKNVTTNVVQFERDRLIFRYFSCLIRTLNLSTRVRPEQSALQKYSRRDFKVEKTYIGAKNSLDNCYRFSSST